jgi:hypothetical protein
LLRLIRGKPMVVVTEGNGRADTAGVRSGHNNRLKRVRGTRGT